MTRTQAEMLTEDAPWAAAVAREPAADGEFFYSVRSTGVFCRPSCASQLPNRRNVLFHATIADAEAAGFRSCKRCRPTEPPLAERYAETVAVACRAIAAAEAPPSLDALAAAASLSPYHVHRVFKAVTGMTPKAYADAECGERVRTGLSGSPTVTQAIYDAGGARGRGRQPGLPLAGRVLSRNPAPMARGGAQDKPIELRGRPRRRPRRQFHRAKCRVDRNTGLGAASQA